MRHNPNPYGKYYLTNDIDLAGEEWTPIDYNYLGSIHHSHLAYFDGQGYVIRNMTITGDHTKMVDLGFGPQYADTHVGLFGNVPFLTIKNLGLENTYIHVSSDANLHQLFVGAIAGSVNSVINCYNTGNITARNRTITRETFEEGGYSDGFPWSARSINRSAGRVTIGGIAGIRTIEAYGGRIYNCYNTANITAQAGDATAGGIVGTGFAEKSYNVGNVTANAVSGYNRVIQENHTMGYREVENFTSGTAIAGGIAGTGILFRSEFDITDCYNTGNISASSFFDFDTPSSTATELPHYLIGGVLAGGIVGTAYHYEITNCYNAGNVSVYSSYNASYSFPQNNPFNWVSPISAGGIAGLSGLGGSEIALGVNCYWNIDSDQINSIRLGNKKGFGSFDDSYATDNTVALTSAQMRQQSYFAGFDFENVWEFRPGVNDGFPVFRGAFAADNIIRLDMDGWLEYLAELRDFLLNLRRAQQAHEDDLKQLIADAAADGFNRLLNLGMFAIAAAPFVPAIAALGTAAFAGGMVMGGIAFYLIMFKCPVDVNILDAEGNILATLKNGEPGIITLDGLTAYSDGYAKHIMVSEEKLSEYRFEPAATGDGVMTVTNMTVNPNGSIWDIAVFADVPLTAGATFDFRLNDGASAQLFGGSREEIKPDAVINDDTLADLLRAEGLTWSAPEVTSAIKRGIATEELLDDFGADTTRAEFCRAAVNFLERYYNMPVEDILEERGLEAQIFADTDDPAIAAAAALGITAGTDISRNLFSPGLPLTREQAATMLKRTLDVIGAEVESEKVGWTDAGDISSWAAEAIDIVFASGIMGGTSTVSLVFSPKRPYTHEQSIVTFNRLWSYITNK
jgi:hypothetical protein